MKLGFGELLIIFVVILFIVGPDKIPSFAKKLGEGMKAFKSATSDMTKEIKENVVDPLNEASAPIREAMEPLTEMKSEIDKSVTDLKRDMASLNSVTKTPVKNTAQVGESELEGAEEPAPKKPMKTAHVGDSSLGEDYSPLVPRHSAKAKAPDEPAAPGEPEAPAEAAAPAEAEAPAQPEAAAQEE